MRVWIPIPCEYKTLVHASFTDKFYASMDFTSMRVWNLGSMRVWIFQSMRVWNLCPDSCEFQGDSKACEFLMLASMGVHFLPASMVPMFGSCEFVSHLRQGCHS